MKLCDPPSWLTTSHSSSLASSSLDLTSSVVRCSSSPPKIRRAIALNILASSLSSPQGFCLLCGLFFVHQLLLVAVKSLDLLKTMQVLSYTVIHISPVSHTDPTLILIWQFGEMIIPTSWFFYLFFFSKMQTVRWPCSSNKTYCTCTGLNNDTLCLGLLLLESICPWYMGEGLVLNQRNESSLQLSSLVSTCTLSDVLQFFSGRKISKTSSVTDKCYNNKDCILHFFLNNKINK